MTPTSPNSENGVRTLTVGSFRWIGEIFKFLPRVSCFRTKSPIRCGAKLKDTCRNYTSAYDAIVVGSMVDQSSSKSHPTAFVIELQHPYRSLVRHLR